MPRQGVPQMSATHTAIRTVTRSKVVTLRVATLVNACHSVTLIIRANHGNATQLRLVTHSNAIQIKNRLQAVIN